MTRLLRVPFFEDEHLNSFASRTARANGRSSLRGFLSDFGVSADRFFQGDDDQVREFASIVGSSPDELICRRVRVNPDKGVDIGGHWLSKHMVTRGRLRFCARCVAGDDLDGRRMPGTRRYGRAAWMISAVRTCHIHDRPLSEAPEAGFRHLAFDFCSLLDSHRDFIIEDSRWDLRRKATDFEVFVVDHMRGQPHRGGLLDGLTLAAAIDACELVGLASRQGRAFRPSRVDQEESRLASDAGFHILRSGAVEFDRLLDALSADSSKSNSRGGQAIYGRLYSLLERRTGGYQSLKAAVRSHALSRHVMLPSASVFGQVEHSSWTTIHAIAMEVDLPDALARRHLTNLGLLDDTAPAKGERLIASDVAKRAVALLKNSVRLTRAAEVLGCTSAEFRRLEQHGLVTAIGSRGSGGVRSRYSEPEIVALRKRLIALADGDPRHMVALRSACGRARMSLANVLSLVINGELRAAYVGTGMLVDTLMVDMAGLAASAKPRDLLTAREVCERLRLHRKGLGVVMAAGLLKAEKSDSPSQSNNPILIPEAEVEAFDRKYATIMKLSEEMGTGPTKLNDALRDAGVPQVLTRAMGSVVVYDRSAIRRT